jgi:hypothetical protein
LFVFRVSFETRLAAQEDDPALLERRYNDKKRKEEDDRYRTHGERMRPYIAAKQTGKSAFTTEVQRPGVHVD